MHCAADRAHCARCSGIAPHSSQDHAAAHALHNAAGHAGKSPARAPGFQLRAGGRLWAAKRAQNKGAGNAASSTHLWLRPEIKIKNNNMDPLGLQNR